MFKETPSALDALMIRSDIQALSNWSLNNDLGHPCLLTTEWKPVPLAQLIKLVAEYVNPIFVILSTTAAPTRRNKKIRKLWGLWGQQLRRSGPKTWTTRRCGSRQLLLATQPLPLRARPSPPAWWSFFRRIITEAFPCMFSRTDFERSKGGKEAKTFPTLIPDLSNLQMFASLSRLLLSYDLQHHLIKFGFRMSVIVSFDKNYST